MSEKPTYTLDEFDLSAHGVMSVRIHGYEPVSVRDIRGDDPDTCECTLSVKHLRLLGSPTVMLAMFEAASDVLRQVVEHPELWDQVVARRVRNALDSDGSEPLTPFWAMPSYNRVAGDEG